MREVETGSEPPLADEAGTALPPLYPDLPLDAALRMFGTHSTLPVVSRRDATRVLGVISVEDVLKAYGIDRR
jgi:hypothetical protein